MAYLNANIPPIYCQDTEGVSYMTLTGHHGESEDCVVFGFASITGKALLFHALCYRMVRSFIDCLSARFSKNVFLDPKCRICQSTQLQLWNCFSYYPSVHCFDWLSGISGKFLGKDKKFYKGQYLFTVDWAHPETNILNTEHSEIPQEHKCAHIIELENGNYAAQPNNRIIWHVNSYTTDKHGQTIKYKIQSGT
jgi:hypothetical protein